MSREPLHGWPRRLLHLAAILAGWVLFVWWWYEVAVQHWNKTLIALIILVTLIAAPAITGAWIVHNLNLYRRKGPRLGAPVVRIGYSRDWNGREVEADWGRLREASVVVVTIEGERKRYVADRPGPTATRP